MGNGMNEARWGDDEEKPTDQIDVPRLRRELAKLKEINRELEHVRANNLLLTREVGNLRDALFESNKKIMSQTAELVGLYRKLNNGNKATT